VKHALHFLALCADAGMSCGVIWRDDAFSMSFWPSEQRKMEIAG
jgi:hypothetical protein